MSLREAGFKRQRWFAPWLLAVVFLALISTGVPAQNSPPFTGEPPNFDALASIEITGAPRQTSDGSALDQFEDRLGLPTFHWVAAADAGTSAAVMALGRMSAVQQQDRRTREQIELAARAHLAAHAAEYRLDQNDVARATLTTVHDTGKGPVIASFKQYVGGIEVFRDEINIVMNQQLALVAISGYIPSARLNTGQGFRQTNLEAVAHALQDLTRVRVPASSLRRTERRQDAYEFVELAAPLAGVVLRQPSRVKAVYFHLPQRLVPAYYIEVDVDAPSESGTTSRAYAYVISAVDGQLLLRNNLTVQDSFSYRVWAEDSGLRRPDDNPTGVGAIPHPSGVPDGTLPTFIAPTLVTLQNGPISTNDPWLPAGATETNGNNVDAYADLVTPDGLSAGDFRANTSSPNMFDYTYNLALQPGANDDQRKAAITQAFYTVNFLHDWFYDYGFDEASGNAQTDNYGRGGLGGDNIKVELQDFQGFNNANMSTPLDGGRPRMQMFLWRPPAVASLTLTGLGAVQTGVAQFGAQQFNVTGQVVEANDGVGPTTDGCEAIPNVAGAIAFVNRGTCAVTLKAQNAQAGGAIGLIIGNNAPGPAPALGGTDPSVTIPTVTISLATADALRIQLSAGPVTATMTRALILNRDGALDNQLIAHEWGHYITNRLIRLGSNQSRSLGEGWGDFHALLLSVRADDVAQLTGAFAFSPYAVGSEITGNNSLYFGLRRVPYSIDFAKNGLTFKHFADGVALPNGVPTAPNREPNFEVHNAGEVWATMLWEAYASLLGDADRLSFDEAQDRMLSYLVAAYKLTPDTPTLLEARDALLAAAFASDAVDFQLFAEAFARRGAGVGAIAPDRFSTNHAGVVESFDVRGHLSIVGASLDAQIIDCDSDGILDNGDTGLLVVTVKNTGWLPLGASTLTVNSPIGAISYPNGATVNIPPLGVFEATSVWVPVRVTGLPGLQGADLNLSAENIAMPSPDIATLSVRLNYDDVPAQARIDDVESDFPVWTPQGTDMWQRIAAAATDHRWLGPDSGFTSDHSLVSPMLVVGSDPLTMQFSHRFDFEAGDFDGGVIELSADGGTTWIDVGSGYTGTVLTTGSTNPLAGRPAFVNRSGGYPSFNPLTLDLGTTYAGQQVLVRFRIGTDQAVGAGGWEIDNIEFTGITNTPFASVIDDPGDCVCLPTNMPPTIGAYAPVTISEGGSTTLWPDAPPSDDRAITSVVASAPGFTGSLSVDAVAGDVTITSAGPVGNHTITVTVTDDCDLTGTRIIDVKVRGIATLAISAPSTVYTGLPQFATVTTTPPGLSGAVLSYTKGGVSVPAPVDAGSYEVTATLTNDLYDAVPVVATFVITHAQLALSWAPPAPIPYGTALGNAQLNATANVGGAFTYTPPAGTVLLPGTHTLTGTFTPHDSVNFAPGIVTTSISVLSQRAVKQSLLTQLRTLATGTTNGQARNTLNSAADRVALSLASPLWAPDGIHLNRWLGNTVFELEKQAASSIESVRKQNRSGIPAAILRGLINGFAAIDRQLAVTAIVAAGSPAAALRELARGDAALAAGHIEDAFERYRHAWMLSVGRAIDD